MSTPSSWHLYYAPVQKIFHPRPSFQASLKFSLAPTLSILKEELISFNLLLWNTNVKVGVQSWINIRLTLTAAEWWGSRSGSGLRWLAGGPWRPSRWQELLPEGQLHWQASAGAPCTLLSHLIMPIHAASFVLTPILYHRSRWQGASYAQHGSLCSSESW